jgi:hypothetical protein
VWILGAITEDDRKMGLGVVVEYANQRGELVRVSAGLLSSAGVQAPR